MVHANYDDYDFDYSETVRKTVRPRTAEPGGLFAPDQDEAHLQHGAMAIREELMERQYYLKGYRDLDCLSADERLRYDFLDSAVGYLALMPGSLTSIWYPTEANEWALIARNLRLHERAAAHEAERSRIAEGAVKGSYSEAATEVSIIFRLLAEHFEAAVEGAELEPASAR